MKIIADTHCHSISSTHAYSTIQELATVAAQQNLYAIAITDHGKKMLGAPGPYYFENLHVLPRFINGVLVLRGIEANIVDFDGSLDHSEYTLKQLDWVVASMHESTMKPCPNKEYATNAWLGICKNPYVRVIGHCGTPAFEFDYERVIPEFGRNGKLVEINANTFGVRSESIGNCKKIAQLCKKYDVPVVVNSDAHFSANVAKVDLPMQMLEEIDFPRELIINADLNAFKDYLGKYVKI